METRTKSYTNLPPSPYSTHIRRNRRSHAGSPSPLAAAVGKPWRTKGRNGGCDGPQPAGASCGREAFPGARNDFEELHESTGRGEREYSKKNLTFCLPGRRWKGAVAQGSHGGRRGARKFAAEARVGEKEKLVYWFGVFGVSLRWA